MEDGISIGESYSPSDLLPIRMDNKVPLQKVDGRGSGAGSGFGKGDEQSILNTDHQGIGKPWSRTYHGSSFPTLGPNEIMAAQKEDDEQAVREICPYKGKMLGDNIFGQEGISVQRW